MKILQAKDIADRMGLKKTTLYQMRQDGRFAPLPLPISSATCSYYSAEEVEAWFEAGTPRRQEWLKIKNKWI